MMADAQRAAGIPAPAPLEHDRLVLAIDLTGPDELDDTERDQVYRLELTDEPGDGGFVGM